MVALANPFTPSFGQIPPYMAGRGPVVNAIVSAFADDPNSPCRNTLLVGARGTGKTVLMASVGRKVARYNWVVANTTAIPGMLDDILQRAVEAAGRKAGHARAARVTGVNFAQMLGLSWEYSAQDANWRSRMNALLDKLAEHDCGLLICVDEVNVGEPEMVECAATYQQFVREGRKVGLLMAGLPMKVDALLNGDAVSFLRRSERFDLGRIEDFEVRSAFLETVEQAGRAIDENALDAAVEAIGGYAYMMQLVGFRIWEVNPRKGRIDAAQAREGIARARRELRTKLFDVAYKDLSKVDRKFLAAMLADGGTDDLNVVAARMGVRRNYAYTYKTRLVNQGVLGEMPDGSLFFEIPGMRAYLAERLGA